MLNTSKKWSLTIHKAKELYADYKQLLKEPGDLTHRPLRLGSGGNVSAELFIARPNEHDPGWAGFFDSKVAPSDFGKSSSPGAVLVLRVEDRWFALTFGTGRFALANDVWEERFGLYTVLNTIRPESVRSIDKQRLDHLQSHVREQSNREAHTREFGIDIEQDILRAVTGMPTDPDQFGERISGSDALHVSFRGGVDSILDFLHLVNARSKEIHYKKEYDWIDNVSRVVDSAVIDELNQKLVATISAGGNPMVWMAVPEIIDWNRVASFRFRTGPKAARRHDIFLEEFLDGFAETPITLDLLKNKDCVALDQDEDECYEWSAFRCLCAEIRRGDHVYVLTNGQWYRVAKSFVQSVESAVAAIDKWEHALPEYDHACEGDYIKDTGKHRRDLAVMDQEWIRIGGGSNKLEFCDLYSHARDIIHLKRKASSSTYSHFFSQALVSAELFRTDEGFRQKVAGLLPDTHELEDHPRVPPKPDRYRVVLGVITDDPGPSVKFPFFSKVGLKNAAKRLAAYGFRVALTNVQVSSSRVQTRKFKRGVRGAGAAGGA